MISATAASIMSSPPARTSTSWSSTPRSTPTPAARPPSPPRSAPWPSSPPAASRSAKKDLGMMAMAYGSVYVAAVSLANPGQCIKAILEAEAYRRSVPHHRLRPLHRPRHRHDQRRGRPEEGGLLRLLAALPLQSGPGRRRAKTRCSWTARRRPSRLMSTPAREPLPDAEEEQPERV